MRVLKNRSMIFYLGFVLILTMAIVGAAIGAFADGPTVTTVVNGNPTGLSETAPATATASTVDLSSGTDKAASFSFPITVTDPRGTGNGWALSVTSSPFTYTSGGSTITLDPSDQHALSVSVPPSGSGAPACGPNSHCSSPTNGISGSPVSMPEDGSTVTKFFNAAQNTGMGTITLSPTFTLFVPADTYAGSYQGTITLSIAAAP